MLARMVLRCRHPVTHVALGRSRYPLDTTRCNAVTIHTALCKSAQFPPSRAWHRVPREATATRCSSTIKDSMATDAPAAGKVFVPPAKIEELFAATAGGKFSSINRPTAGAREEKALPEGSAPIQLYSLGTPNGNKVHILLEELADAAGLQYDAHKVIINGEQFTSGFVGVNPNSKIPALVDKETPDGKPLNIFESGSINLYLCEKYGHFLPKDVRLRTEALNWTFWQMGGQGPITGACFGHFFVYAPDDKVEAREYGIARYGMEVQRLCSVLDQALEGKTYLVGEQYTLADIMCFPWVHQLRTGYKHSSGLAAGEFLSFDQYKNINAWADRILQRPAVQRGLQVCQFASESSKPWLDQGASTKA